ncbi:hypothetical protein [Cyanobium sp. CH-040]|uniref:hypothetical protein n=1 Tax=Cyanobium sp. CH-040 TaxID=2823708 RepID=UPI0020CEC6E8|nr:hypothetical protein [Cyanobium sp. CH-040]
MRDHPIPPVTEPLQYRAIGLVRGTYVPAADDQINRGAIHTADGEQLEAVVLGRLLTLLRRHVDLAEPHLWVVYPRSREEGGLHLQMVGIWEPSTLAATDAEAPAEATSDATPTEPPAGDALPEGDDYFSVRGELVFTKPETGDLVVKVRQRPRGDGQRPAPFKLQLRGEVPLEHLRHFVSLDLRRQGQALTLEGLEVIGPVAQRGNRGGKDRRRQPDKRPRGGHQGGQPRGPESPRRTAVLRPGR